MTTLYCFLFFLQNQSLYFGYQDAILDTLSKNPDINFEEFSIKINELCPMLLEKTLEKMASQPSPFVSPSVQRIKYGDLSYPFEFTQLQDPPLVISVRGAPIWNVQKLAIVGSRRPSQKSLWWLSMELKSILSKNEVVSVSGGAIGVDQLIHRASIELKRPTIAILPSGLSDIYPKSFQAASEDVVKFGGCLISEFADLQSVRTYHFSHRNRLIAALGKVSIIVEAREKSGSLITAHRALELGKDVLVVPGHPLDDSFRGSLQLLKMGAHIISHADDLEYLA